MLQFHPAQYTSAGTIISPVNVAPESSALSVFRLEKFVFIVLREADIASVDCIVVIVDILCRDYSGCVSGSRRNSSICSPSIRYCTPYIRSSSPSIRLET